MGRLVGVGVGESGPLARRLEAAAYFPRHGDGVTVTRGLLVGYDDDQY